MTNYISHYGLKILGFLMLMLCVSCTESSPKNGFKEYKKAQLTLESGTRLDLYLALSMEEQALGLSHVQPEEFKDTDAMLFASDHYAERQFWMPETFFNLDIIFLNANLKVMDIDRNVPFYTQNTPQEKIPLSKSVISQHVLEMKSSSPYAKEIKKGMTLKWSSEPSLSKIMSQASQE